MFGLTTRSTARSAARRLTLRRSRHDTTLKPGVTYLFKNIDIASAAQRSTFSADRVADADPALPLEEFASAVQRPSTNSQDAAAHKPPGASSSRPQRDPPLSVNIQRHARGPDTPKAVDVTVKINLMSVLWGVVVTFILVKFWQQWNKAGNFAFAQATRLIAEAPDLSVLQEDPDALAAHFDALVRALLPPPMHEGFARALARRRAEGDAGKAAVLEACVELHKMVQDTSMGAAGKARKLMMILDKFVDRQRKPRPDSGSTESNVISDSTEQPTDFEPPMKG
ncbi:hypothetical protein C8R45DRAFT_1095040 [Mycena sanguinolenta]|nr:hypothetical protein C8R45DRAFT_1095040 [Mycena sanguinolenta]